MFDSDTGSPIVQGFVEVKPVADIPSRALSDTMYELDRFPSNKDRQHCQFTGERVGSHKDAGVIENSGTEFADDHAEHNNGNVQNVEEVNEGKE